MTAMRDFSAIVLAAGRSRRWGGGNKLLQPLDGRPLASHAFETVAGLGLAEGIVITGHNNATMEFLAIQHKLTPMHNARYTDGMGHSIATGVTALKARARGLFIHLADVPLVSAATFRALAAAMERDDVSVFKAFVPVFERRRGHPVLFRAELLPELAALRGDFGAKSILDAHPVREIEVPDRFVIRDIDKRTDLIELRAQRHMHSTCLPARTS